jgi:hypothetical protein
LSRWSLGAAATVLPLSDHFKSGQRLSLQTGKVSPNFLSADFAVLEGSWRPQEAVDHVTRVEVVSRDIPRRVDAAVGGTLTGARARSTAISPEEPEKAVPSASLTSSFHKEPGFQYYSLPEEYIAFPRKEIPFVGSRMHYL